MSDLLLFTNVPEKHRQPPDALTRDEVNLVRRFTQISLDILERFTQEFEDKKALYDFVRATAAQHKRALDELTDQVERINRLLILERTGSNDAEAREIRSEINQELRSVQWQLQRRTSNLNYLSEQAASYGSHIPLDLMNQIIDEQAEIHRLQSKLKT